MNEPVLFLPGMLCDARAFLPQIAALSRDWPLQVACYGDADSIAAMARAALAGAPEGFALAGHSMGGIVAMEMLRQAPERVTRVALISTSPLVQNRAEADWRAPLRARLARGAFDAVLERAMPPENLAPGPGRERVLETVRAMGRTQGAARYLAQDRALADRRDAREVLGATRMAGLVLCGAHDRMTPVRQHRAMAGLIAHSVLEVIEDAGHFPMLEAPEAVTDALRAWLERPLMLR